MTYDDVPYTTNIINQPDCYSIDDYSLIQNNDYLLIGLHITECLHKIQNRRRNTNILLASAVDNQ